MKHRTASFSFLQCLIAAVVVLLTVQCGPTTKLTGAGVETTNGCITGVLLREDGHPAAEALVRLFPADYNPVTTAETVAPAVADAAGRFTFTGIDTGSYSIIAAETDLGTMAASYGIAVAGDTANLPSVTMWPPGSIKIRIPDRCDTNTGSFYIPGTGMFVVLKDASDGMVVIDSVPAGVVPGILYTINAGSIAPEVLIDSVVVLSGVTVTIAFTDWVWSRTISLNTTSSGAGVPSDVTDFPVLLRLRWPDFDFSQVNTDGCDLRFSKSDGVPLPYEIEEWDPVNGRAEVWVKVDTVFGDNDRQYIVVYWGNPDAGSASGPSAVFAGDTSSGSAVFDTTNGFIGVWHLDSTCTDATGRGHDGINYGSVDVEGVIGSAKKFDGADSIKIAGLLGTPVNVTLSAWVKTDTSPSTGQEIISIGDAVLIRADENNGYGTGGYTHQNSEDTSFTKVTSGVNIAKTGWRYISFSFNNHDHTQMLYIDGELVTTVNSTYAIDYTGVGSNTFIGIHGNGKRAAYAMRGDIDEVRVCNIVRTADWIKLCYMNQQSEDRLTHFK